MIDHNFSSIREDLKKILKNRKVKYEQLASKMGVSESGIKKMLNSEDLSFNKISRILSTAGIGVSEFFKLLEETTPPEKSLSPKQEDYFVKNPSAYHFFHQLLELNLDWKKLKSRHGLTQKSVDSYLLALDKIGVIELHQGHAVKSQFAGNCRLSFGMKLVKMVVDDRHRSLLSFAHIPNEKFRGRKHLANGVLSLKPSTAAEFNQAFRGLVSEYMKRSEREAVFEPENQREDIGFLVIVTPTEGMPYQNIPNIS